MALVLAHVSDLHVSRYGEHLPSLRGFWKRPVKADPEWEEVSIVDGWRIERRPRGKAKDGGGPASWELRLVDESGYLQERVKAPREREYPMRKMLEALVEQRKRTEHARLAASWPEEAAVAELLAIDPENTNLLFHRVASALRADAPDWVLLTGDLTDDGVGFDLVESWLAPFVEKRRLLAIPGNHDVYDSPALMVPPLERLTAKEKRALWAVFAEDLGLPPAGPWVRPLGEGVLMAGLDSCVPPRVPSASGAVPEADLDALGAELAAAPAEATRLAMLHHHVVNPGKAGTGASPWQLGMRLRNASAVYAWLAAQQFTCVLNGHRHVGYRYHPAHAPLFISAPSATLGCASGAGPFYWRIEIEDGKIVSVRERPLG